MNVTLGYRWIAWTTLIGMAMSGCTKSHLWNGRSSGRGEATETVDSGFFTNCAFVCVDIQPGIKHDMTVETMPKSWRERGFSEEDVNAAIAYTYDVAHPNARKVADACRDMKLPMIFVHWGYSFKDGMDLAPDIRNAFLADHGTHYDRWPHHISREDSRPADILGVRDGEYIIAKTAQDAFPSSNIGFVLRNLGIQNIVFVGGHTGACLGKTAASAKRRGYRILCVTDATFDARHSTWRPNLEATGYDHLVTTDAFIALARARYRAIRAIDMRAEQISVCRSLTKRSKIRVHRR